MNQYVKGILIKSGWYENRIIDIDPIVSYVNKMGIEYPNKIKQFLQCYGLLYVKFTTRMGKTEEFNFDPCFAIGDSLNLAYIQDSIEEPYGGILRGEPVYPIGSCFRDNMLIVVCNTGKCFAYTDSCFMKLGDTFEEMLECLLELRMPEFYDD